ncbi:MAG: hypothetical protein U5K30_04475 [Acidimicrobiales bacterium]|nr:hypothetical protein [Acidimicrobiales bacterium]
MTDRRGPLRLVVPSPDGTRLLARPNGLAGWALPTMAVDVPFEGWSDELVARAGRAIGTPVRPLRRVDEDVWAVEPADRIRAAGNTWIGAAEVERLGADADAARAWFAEPDVADPTP